MGKKMKAISASICLLIVVVIIGFIMRGTWGKKDISEHLEPAELNGMYASVGQETDPVENETVALFETSDGSAETETPEIGESKQIIYEGIDYESTLPGLEWVSTLNGIIDEPKLVAFNDTTNKKVIIENGQELEFSMSDKLAIYIPEGTGSVIDIDMDVFNKSTLGLVSYVEEISGKYEVGESAVTHNVIRFNGQEMILTATLIFTD